MKVQPKKILIGLAVALILMIVWADPAGAGEAVGDFMGKATSWVGDAFDKATVFAQAVVE